MSFSDALDSAALRSTNIDVPHVLVVDDNKEDAEVVERVLTDTRLPPHGANFEINIVTTATGVDPYIAVDSIDIYIVDLKFEESCAYIEQTVETGQRLISEIREASNAGIIVYSSEPAEMQTAAALLRGADDYVWKSWGADILKAKVYALWRNIRLRRPLISEFPIHKGKSYLVGNWHFLIGKRELQNQEGQLIKLSALEYALLRHLVTVEDHEINRENFFAYILGRDFSSTDRRLDSLVHRLRNKLGVSAEIISIRDAGYKLLSVFPSNDTSIARSSSRLRRVRS